MLPIIIMNKDGFEISYKPNSDVISDGGKLFRTDIKLHFELMVVYMFRIISFVILCIICSCTSTRYNTNNRVSAYYNEAFVPAQSRRVQTILVICSNNKKYELLEYNTSLFPNYNDRQESGVWERKSDTLFLYPQWEITYSVDTIKVKNLSLSENQDYFSRKKVLLFKKHSLIGISLSDDNVSDLLQFDSIPYFSEREIFKPL